MSGWLEALIDSTGLWTLIGVVIGVVLTQFQERRKAKMVRRGLGGLLYGELLVMDLGERFIGDDPPTARQLSLNALPQLLAPGIIDPEKEDDLLMQLITLAAAVNRFNDKARTYNAAWASDQHPDMQRRCFQDLEMAALDYGKAHALTMRQIEIGRLGKPLPLNEEPRLSPRQRFRSWWERQIRLVKHRLKSG